MCRRRRRKLEDTVDSDTLMLKQTKECKTMPNKYHPQIKHKASRRLLLVLLPSCEEEAAIEESGRRVLRLASHPLQNVRLVSCLYSWLNKSIMVSDLPSKRR